jgi:hypothetical protein
MLEEMPRTRKIDRVSKLAPPFSSNMFSPADVTQERVEYRNLLRQLVREWEEQKIRLENEEKLLLLEQQLSNDIKSKNYEKVSVFKYYVLFF